MRNVAALIVCALPAAARVVLTTNGTCRVLGFSWLVPFEVRAAELVVQLNGDFETLETSS